jgi:hypothetical protein
MTVDERELSRLREQSEGVQAIQQELSTLQTSLFTLRTEYTQCGNPVERTSLLFRDLLSTAYTRVKTLQKHAKLLLEREREFTRQRQQFTAIAQRRIQATRIDSSAVNATLLTLRDALARDGSEVQRISQAVNHLRSSILKMMNEEDEIDERTTGLQLPKAAAVADGRTDIAIELTRATERMQILDAQLADQRESVQKLEQSLNDIHANSQIIAEIKAEISQITVLKSRLKTTKEQRREQEARRKTLQTQIAVRTTEISHVHRQLGSLQADQAFAAGAEQGRVLGSLVTSNRQLMEEVDAGKDEFRAIVDEEKTAESQLSDVLTEIKKEDRRSAFLDTQSEIVALDSQSQREAMPKRADLEDLELRIRDELTSESLYKSRLGRFDAAIDPQELSTLKIEQLVTSDSVLAELGTAESEVKQLRLDVEAALWKQNVLEAEILRLRRRSAPDSSLDFVIDIEQRRSQYFTKRSEVTTQIRRLSKQVEEKSASMSVRIARLTEKRRSHEQSIDAWSKRSFGSVLQNGSPMVRPSQSSVLTRYFQVLKLSFIDQARLIRQDDVTDADLHSWGSDIDAANRKLSSSSLASLTEIRF